MFPVRLKGDSRYTSSMCRVIALTTAGVSTISILNYIVSDILNASTVGIKIIGPFGIDICIFIAVIGFVSNFPALSSVLCVKAHFANKPSLLRTFTRKQDILRSAYGYTTMITSKLTFNVQFV